MSELPESGQRSHRAALAERFGLFGALVLLVAVFSLLSDSFLSARTGQTIANQIPDLLVISIGMTLVLVAGGIDLSVGSLLAFASATLGVSMVDFGVPFVPAALLALMAGALCGLVSGTISVLARLPSFIVTLGMLEVARGGAYLLTDSQTRYIGAAVEPIGAPLPGLGVSPAFVVAVIVVALAQLTLSRTVLGRYLIAIGANEEAVRMSGVDTRRYKIAAFAISGLLCGLGAVMHTSRLGSADPNAAVGLELQAIAAAVIGGTSLLGGRGSAVNTFLGVLIIAVLESGLATTGASEPTKRLITGGVIVGAALLDVWRRRLRGRLRPGNQQSN